MAAAAAVNTINSSSAVAWPGAVPQHVTGQSRMRLLAGNAVGMMGNGRGNMATGVNAEGNGSINNGAVTTGSSGRGGGFFYGNGSATTGSSGRGGGMTPSGMSLLDFPTGVSPSPLPTIEQTPNRFMSKLDMEPNPFEQSFLSSSAGLPIPDPHSGTGYSASPKPILPPLSMPPSGIIGPHSGNGNVSSPRLSPWILSAISGRPAMSSAGAPVGTSLMGALDAPPPTYPTSGLRMSYTNAMPPNPSPNTLNNINPHIGLHLRPPAPLLTPNSAAILAVLNSGTLDDLATSAALMPTMPPPPPPSQQHPTHPRPPPPSETSSASNNSSLLSHSHRTSSTCSALSDGLPNTHAPFHPPTNPLPTIPNRTWLPSHHTSNPYDDNTPPPSATSTNSSARPSPLLINTSVVAQQGQQGHHVFQYQQPVVQPPACGQLPPQMHGARPPPLAGMPGTGATDERGSSPRKRGREDEAPASKKRTRAAASVNDEVASPAATVDSPASATTAPKRKRKGKKAVSEREHSAAASTGYGSSNGNGSENEEDKRRSFLERNRQAALKCRQKKKEQTALLQKQVNELTEQNGRLVREAEELREHVVYIKGLLMQHQDCPVAIANGLNLAND
ncbi:hypothetical protein HK101_004246 [Irineochytrium annulatum]|nr:hypothetical protein HK101_004246 [Irineochytrium annulatum]